MTAKEQIIQAAIELKQIQQRDWFTIEEVIHYINLKGTQLQESTIRTHICSVMCKNAPQNHFNHSDELERVGRGKYRLRR